VTVDADGRITSAASGTIPAAEALGTTGADVDVGSAAPPSIGQVLTATSATTATWQAPGGGGITLTAATITVPYESQEQTVTVVDAAATSLSNVSVGWGNTLPTDENQPTASNVTFSAVAAAGSIDITVSDNDVGMVGGAYKILYSIG
jgi:hypothetical protein